MKDALLKACLLLAYYPSLFDILGLYLDHKFSIRMIFTIVICTGV
jgi:hypothetical protein